MVQQIPLQRGRFALVDDTDYEMIAAYKWHINGPGYVEGTVTVDGSRKRVYLHRLLLHAQKGEIVDHLDGNPLNNTRANLRLVTLAQNQWNRKRQANMSGYKGVCWHQGNQKFYARIQVNRKRLFLGYFDTAAEAAVAYDAAAERFYGEYAYHSRPAAD